MAGLLQFEMSLRTHQLHLIMATLVLPLSVVKSVDEEREKVLFPFRPSQPTTA